MWFSLLDVPKCVRPIDHNLLVINRYFSVLTENDPVPYSTADTVMTT